MNRPKSRTGHQFFRPKIADKVYTGRNMTGSGHCGLIRPSMDHGSHVRRGWISHTHGDDISNRRELLKSAGPSAGMRGFISMEGYL